MATKRRPAPTAAKTKPDLKEAASELREALAQRLRRTVASVKQGARAGAGKLKATVAKDVGIVRSAVKRTAAKVNRAATKRLAELKSASQKAPAKKSVAKKAAAKKTTARKATARKTAAKKAAAR